MYFKWTMYLMLTALIGCSRDSDRYTQQAIVSSCLVGTWELSPNTISSMSQIINELANPCPFPPWKTIILNDNGTYICKDMYINNGNQINIINTQASGKWSIKYSTPVYGGNLPNSACVYFTECAPMPNGKLIKENALYIMIESDGKYVMWEYYGDLDVYRHQEYYKMDGMP